MIENSLKPRRGFVLSGPMGGNKNGTGQSFMEWVAPLDQRYYGTARQMPPSWTTRSRRDSDTPGQYIYDKTRKEFRAGIKRGELVEWAEHSGNRYGKTMPDLTKPFFVECEVTGGQQFVKMMGRASMLGDLSMAYVRQANGAPQLLNQIMARPGKESEQHRIMRAARYPGELAFILEQELPYIFINNHPEVKNSPYTPAKYAAAGVALCVVTRTMIEDDIARAQAFFEPLIDGPLPEVKPQA